jgi:hypothetical protein
MVGVHPNPDIGSATFQRSIVHTVSHLACTNPTDGITVPSLLGALQIRIAKGGGAANSDCKRMALHLRIVSTIRHTAFINHGHFHSHGASPVQFFLLAEIALFHSSPRSLKNYA